MFWSAVLNVDMFIHTWINTVRIEPLFLFFKYFTYAGSVAVSFALLFAITYGLVKCNGKHYILYLWSAFITAELTTWLLKIIVNRPRPDIVNGVMETNPSFPSGHATAITCIAVFLSYLVIRLQTSSVSRTVCLAGIAATASLVLFSRLYLGVHYFSDIVAGVFVGAFWALVCMRLCERFVATHR